MSGCQPYGRTFGLGQTMNAIQYRQVAMNRSLHQWRVRPSRVSPRISPESVGDDEWIATCTENEPRHHVGVNCPFYPSMIYIVSLYIYILLLLLLLLYILLLYIYIFIIIIIYIIIIYIYIIIYIIYIIYYIILYIYNTIYIIYFTLYIYYNILYYIILYYIILYIYIIDIF